MYLKGNAWARTFAPRIVLPLVEMSTAQRVLSLAMGCFMRSLMTMGKLLFARAAEAGNGLGYLKAMFFS